MAQRARRARVRKGSQLPTRRHPGAVDAALEVLKEDGPLADRDRGDPVEQEAQLLLGAKGGAHLDEATARARVGAPEDVCREPGSGPEGGRAPARGEAS